MRLIHLRIPDPATILLPFGRYFGERVWDAPSSYLWWLLLLMTKRELSPTVERAIWAALAMRREQS